MLGFDRTEHDVPIAILRGGREYGRRSQPPAPAHVATSDVRGNARWRMSTGVRNQSPDFVSHHEGGFSGKDVAGRRQPAPTGLQQEHDRHGADGRECHGMTESALTQCRNGRRFASGHRQTLSNRTASPSSDPTDISSTRCNRQIQPNPPVLNSCAGTALSEKPQILLHTRVASTVTDAMGHECDGARFSIGWLSVRGAGSGSVGILRFSLHTRGCL
jgi:hypothetical protein